VGTLVFYIMWVNHVGGCLWHIAGEEARIHWYLDGNFAEVSQNGRAFDYLVGFYWSAASMIAGGSIMTPRTTLEILTTVFFVVFGFIFSSVLISSLLSIVMEYQNANKERDDKLKTLRQFLYQHRVDLRVAVPIVTQVSARMGTRKWISEGEVTALSLLSPTMHLELWFQIYGPSMATNPMICACNSVDCGLVKEICYRALQHASHRPGTRIFQAGVEAVGAHYVYGGSLDYVPSRTNALQDVTSCHLSGKTDDDLGAQRAVSKTRGPVIATQGAWISEVALWVHWLHRGWLDATTPCEVLTLQAEPLIRILTAHSDFHQIVIDYSCSLLTSLQQEPPQLLTDLHMPVSHQNIVVAMPLETRVLLSRSAMEVLESKHQWPSRLLKSPCVQDLRTEIERGECDLMVDSSDRVLRVVTVVALRLSRFDGAVLWEIAQLTSGNCAVNCQHPGSKVHVGENPKMAVERILAEKLAPLRDKISFRGHTMDVEDRVSKKYGVKSRYMRTLFKASLAEYDSACMKVILRNDAAPSETRSTSSWGSELHLADSLEAFVFRGDLARKPRKLAIYAWLTPEEHSHFATPHGEAVLQEWIGGLDVNVLHELALGNGRSALPCAILTSKE